MGSRHFLLIPFRSFSSEFERLFHRLMPIFSLLILTALALIVHELGHLAAAGRCNVPASELGLGFG
jgi:hypothetical protein